MNNKLANAVLTLVDVTTFSNDFDSLKSQLMGNKDNVADALQFIADADKEGCLESAHLALLHTCPKEVEGHVMAVNTLFLTLIGEAWQNYGQSVSTALDAWFGPKDEEQPSGNTDKIQFLESCLDLESSWKF